MDKKMKGIADPFTLGLVIALLGSVAASNLSSSGESSAVQSVNSNQLTDTAIVALNEEEDE